MTTTESRWSDWPDWTHDPIAGRQRQPSRPPIVVETQFEAPPAPPHVLYRGLLLTPRVFGGSVAQLLKHARSLILRARNLPESQALRDIAPREARDEIAHAKRLLEGRPQGARLRQPAFLDCSNGYLVVGLPSGVTPPERAACARIWSESGELASPIPLRRIDFDRHDRGEVKIEHPHAGSQVLRNCAQCWIGLLHEWDPGDRLLAVEVSPSPTSFMSAMSIGFRGIGRIVVGSGSASACPDGARIFASGWTTGSPLRDLTSGRWPSCEEASRDCSLIHIPDPDLFAACAARTWTPSLADAAWLASRPERHFLD